MRIMHISTRLILGGSQENTVLSCQGQADDGHTVALVYGPIYGPEGSLLDRVRDDGRIDAIESPNLVRDLAPLRDWRALRDLQSLIRDWKPDVVHTHSSKAGIIGRIAAWRQRVPAVVHTVHGPPFHRYEKLWRNAIYVACERYAARRCHRIICVAEAMREQYLARGIGRPEQYDIVYSGMDTAPFLQHEDDRDATRASLGIAPNDFVIGTVARLAELKGHDDLLDAVAPIADDRPNLRLLWVGDGWWRDRLMARAESLGLADRIVTTGLVSPDRIPVLMRGMDAVAHPSSREGLPRSVTQALLSARPVIAYDVDGTGEVCIDGETGRLVAPGDVSGLRDAICWTMDHREEAARWAERGRAMCRERFDAAVMVAALEGVYAKVLGGSMDTDRADHQRAGSAR